MAGPEEKSPSAPDPIETEEESTMKGNLPPALLAVVGRKPRGGTSTAPQPDQTGKRTKTSRAPNDDAIPESDIVRLPTSITKLEEDDDSVESSVSTSTAPRSKLPFHIPGAVEIRTVEHDELLDETEVKTVPGNTAPSTARPAAGRPPSAHPADDDDSVTTRAPAFSSASMKAVPSTVRDEPAPISRSLDEPLTSPGVDPPTLPGTVDSPTADGKLPAPNAEPDDDDQEDSITRMAPQAANLAPKILANEDDSTQGSTAPVVHDAILAQLKSGPAAPGTLKGDDSDGTTRRQQAPALPNFDDATESTESVTEQATKVRGVTEPAPPPQDHLVMLHDDGDADGGTKVMPNAPAMQPVAPGFPPPATPYKKPRKPTLHGIAPPAELLPSHRPANAPPMATVGATKSEPPKAIESESALRVVKPTEAAPDRANPAAVFGGVPSSVASGVPANTGSVVAVIPKPTDSRPDVAVSGMGKTTLPLSGPVLVPDGTPLPPSAFTAAGLGHDHTPIPVSTRGGPIGPVLVPDGTPLPLSQRMSLEPPPSSLMPSKSVALQDYDFGGTVKVPRYGLLVGVVAVVCAIIPVALYFALRQPSESLVPIPAEVVSVPVKRGDAVRGKQEGRHRDPVPTTPTTKKDPRKR